MSILDRIVQQNFMILGAVQANSAKLDQILAILNEPDAIAGAAITLGEGENSMAKITKHSGAKAVIGDFQLLDNGTALGTISFVDSVGEPTVPAAGATVSTSAVSSDPGITASVDATGLVLTLAPTQPLPVPLPTGVTVTATITITNTDGSVVGPFTATTVPIDLEAGGPAGASITLS